VRPGIGAKERNPAAELLGDSNLKAVIPGGAGIHVLQHLLIAARHGCDRTRSIRGRNRASLTGSRADEWRRRVEIHRLLDVDGVRADIVHREQPAAFQVVFEAQVPLLGVRVLEIGIVGRIRG